MFIRADAPQHCSIHYTLHYHHNIEIFLSPTPPTPPMDIGAPPTVEMPIKIKTAPDEEDDLEDDDDVVVDKEEEEESDSAVVSRQASTQAPLGPGTGLDTLGGGMRKMVELINKLRAAGIEGLGLGLPRIAVVGNQSAGKSSLIEAISGVGLFRLLVGICSRADMWSR